MASVKRREGLGASRAALLTEIFFSPFFTLLPNKLNNAWKRPLQVTRGRSTLVCVAIVSFCTEELERCRIAWVARRSKVVSSLSVLFPYPLAPKLSCASRALPKETTPT